MAEIFNEETVRGMDILAAILFSYDILPFQAKLSGGPLSLVNCNVVVLHSLLKVQRTWPAFLANMREKGATGIIASITCLSTAVILSSCQRG